MATRQYIGARYIPKIVGDWDNTKEYEPLMVVYYNGASYTSKTYIPTGIDISNTTYWALSADYNAQVAAYRAEVLAYTDFLKGIFVTPEDFGAVGDGITDDTAAIQAALNNSKVVYFHNKKYAIDIETHIVPNDGNVLIIDNATLFGLPAANPSTNTHFEPVIDIIDVKDVIITGNNGIIDGNRDNQQSGEWASGIRITNSDNIKIYNINCINCHGDGIEIYRYNTNIMIDHVTCDNNYRQGLTVGGVENCTISNSIFTNTNGTDPQAGIDVEVEADYRAINVSIVNCEAANNKYGILVASKNHTESGYTIRNISISNCNIIDCSDAGLRIECKDNAVISNCTVKNSHNGLWVRYSDGVTIDNIICDSNDNNGVIFMGSENCILSNSIVKNNAVGIYFTSGNSKTTLSGNYIYNNTSEGVKMYASSESNKNHDILLKNNIISNNRVGREYVRYSAEVDVLNYADDITLEGNIINNDNDRTDYAVHGQSNILIVYTNNLANFVSGAYAGTKLTHYNIVDNKLLFGSLDVHSLTDSSPDTVRNLLADQPEGSTVHFNIYYSHVSTSDGFLGQYNVAGFVSKVTSNQYILKAWDSEGNEYRCGSGSTWTVVS